MSLSVETATMIVNAVAADGACKNAVQPSPIFDTLFAVPMLGLEVTGLAGSARNLAMIFQGKGAGDKDFDEKICLGIAMVTANAIRKAGIPGIRSVATAHREHWGVHHEGTWIRMTDESQYVFDWHATLRVRDPLISTFDDFMLATNATHFALFSGL
jgi:hypothetical protein